MKKKREVWFPVGDEMRLQFRKMKLTAIFLFIVFVTFGNSFSQVRLSVHFDKSDIRDVLQTIEEKTDYIFLYKDNIFDFSQKISADFTDAKFDDVLKDFCNQTNVSYEVRDRQIILKEKEVIPLPGEQQPQKKEIQGKVTDSSGAPMPGVSIVIKGTTTGTVTGSDGKFSLANVPSGATIRFSFIGMKPHEVIVGTQTIINVVLQEETVGIDEVVAIGYGTAKRKDVMGAVSSVSADELIKAPVASAIEAMAGKMAGVQVTTTEGNPDATINIRVRGGGSITGDNSPLFIVDGFPVDNINDIAPSNIASIDVLKDASSTAIYGSRGAYGVVIVTTKSGDKSGKLKVSFNSFYATKKMAKRLNVLSPQDFVKYQYELAALRNSVPDTYEPVFGKYEDIDLYNGMVGNDWQKQIFGKVGYAFNNNLSIMGGSNVINYAFNYANIQDNAIMIGSEYKRDNLSLKLNSTPTKKITLDFSVRYSNTQIKGGGSNSLEDVGSTSYPRLKQAIMYAPIPISGMINTVDTEIHASDLINPIVSVNDNDANRLERNWNAASSFGWEIIDNLKFKSEFGLNEYFRDNNRFYGTSTYFVRNWVGSYVNMPATIETNIHKRTFRNTNTLYYDFKDILNEKHSVNLLLGQERIIAVSSSVENDVWGLPTFFDANMAFHFMSSGHAAVISHFYNPDDKLLSFFGRLNYAYLNKYLFSATFRADGSNKFAKQNHWGYFPSVSVGWRLSEEEFMKNDWLDNLKLRFSYGTAGNNNIPANQMNKIFGGSSTRFLNNTSSFWSAGTLLDNPDLKWETTYTRNLGVDFGVLKNRLNGTFDLYQNNTKDLLMQFSVAGSGYNYQYRNMGETQNKGVELSLNYAAIEKKDYSLSFAFNIGFNRGKIVSMGVMEDFGATSGWADTEINVDYWIAKNGALGDLYGYHIDGNGRYEVSDFQGYDQTLKKWILKDGVPNTSTSILGHNVRPGDLKLKDLNGKDGVTIDDREIIGNTNPKNTGGFSIAGRVKNFDLTANFNWVYGNKIYNANKVEFTSSREYSYRNMIDIMADGKRWTNLLPDGTISNDPVTLAQMNVNTTMWSPNIQTAVLTDWAIEDGSFLRLSTLALGYTIPATFTNKVKISNLRLYVTGYNVFCLTNYSGYDPEVDTARSTPLTPNVDYSAYPKSRQLVFGVNVNF